MNWEEVLKVVEPLLSNRGYLQARAFVMSRKTYECGWWIFKKSRETQFLASPTATGEGLCLRVEHDTWDWVIVY